MNNSILIVEDEFLISLHFSSVVEDMGLTVCAVAETASDAIREAIAHRPPVVLMDVRLRGDADGVDAAIRIHETVGSKVIFVTGSREPETITRIESDHPYATLFKPVSDETLSATIRRALAHAS